MRNDIPNIDQHVIVLLYCVLGTLLLYLARYKINQKLLYIYIYILLLLLLLYKIFVDTTNINDIITIRIQTVVVVSPAILTNQRYICLTVLIKGSWTFAYQNHCLLFHCPMCFVPYSFYVFSLLLLLSLSLSLLLCKTDYVFLIWQHKQVDRFLFLLGALWGTQMTTTQWLVDYVQKLSRIVSRVTNVMNS